MQHGADTVARTVDWLWKPYLQRGAINLLTGDPGIGKTSLVCEIAARITRGEALPGGDAGPPGNVWIMNGEDGIEDTIIWRLDNQRADRNRVWMTGTATAIDEPGAREIEEKVRRHNITMLVVDPIQAWIGKDTNMNQANETRAWAAYLRDIAVRNNIAILMVRHRRKGAPGDQHIYTGLGSIDITGFARSEISILRSETGICYLTRTKGNVGGTGLKLAYSLEPHPDPLNDHAVLTWRGEIDPESGPANISKIPKRLNAAKEWLQSRLAKGPERVISLRQAAGQANFTLGTLQKAKEAVAESYQEPTETGAVWYWRLKDGKPHGTGDAEPPEHSVVGRPAG